MSPKGWSISASNTEANSTLFITKGGGGGGGALKSVRGWQFLTIEPAAEILCMVRLPPEEPIFRKKYLGNPPFKKSHFVRI